MAETRHHQTAYERVDEEAQGAKAQSNTAFVAAATLLSDSGGTVATAASPGEITKIQTAVTTLPDGTVTTTVVTTTTVTTTTTTTTTTSTFLTGEISPITVQQVAQAPQQSAQKPQLLAAETRVVAGNPLSYRFAKRAFDIVFSALVIVVCFIPGLLLSVAVAISTKESPFYTQKRVGQNGKSFRMFKFRTMVADSDDLEKHFTPTQLREWHTEHKVKNDPRITALGRFLRRTSIDEIPNFLNVFAGQMSVVGPRAITRGELHWFGDDLDEMLSVPAGITGWWQVESRNNATFKSGERQKLEMFYVRHASVSLDIRIMLRTVRAMISGTGN